jgi:hypothetical protein
MKLRTLFVVLFALAAMSVSAQKLTGDLSPLKGQKEVNVVLDFSTTLVNGKAEAKYIADETKGKMPEEKEQWLTEWTKNLPSNAYSMLTNDLFKTMKEPYFLVGDYPDADYTIHIRIIDITTGYFAGVMAKASAIKSEVIFIKKGEETPTAVVLYKSSCSVISSTIPYFVTRIAMSFGKMGDDIANTINKNFKK